MFCNISSIKIIENLQKRMLRIVYKKENSNLDELLKLNNTPTFHQKHLQILMTEIFKSINNFSAGLTSNLFNLKSTSYNLRNKNSLCLPKTNSIIYGTNSIIFKGSIIWNKMPNELKEIKSLSLFKTKIRKWICDFCTCQCCKRRR